MINSEGLKKSIQGLKNALRVSNPINFNLEDLVRPVRTGRDIGTTVGVITGAVKGPTLLSNYVSGNILGIQSASILGGAIGAIPGALVGYAAVNTAYKLTRDTYNLIRHPIKTVKKIGSGIKSLVKRPYRLFTKPLAYMFVPVLKKKSKEINKK